MMKKFLFIPLLLMTVAVAAEPIVRVVNTNGSDKAFATDNVRRLVLTATAVDVENNEGIVLVSVPLAEIARVEFTDGTPGQTTSVEATLLYDEDAVKIIEHGQVYILRSGRKYTIMGVAVENKE